MTDYRKVTTALLALLEEGDDAAELAARGLWEQARFGLTIEFGSALPGSREREMTARLASLEVLASREALAPPRVAHFLRLARRLVIGRYLSGGMIPRSTLAPAEGDGQDPTVPSLPPLLDVPEISQSMLEMTVEEGRWEVTVKASGLAPEDGDREPSAPARSSRGRCVVCAAMDWRVIADHSHGSNAGGEYHVELHCRSCAMVSTYYREWG